MSFVRGIGVSREDEAIARAILSLGKTLDFEVVAEGVESEAQLGFLKKIWLQCGSGLPLCKADGCAAGSILYPKA
jgi:EAL domain-containing protein (putative c-di-GMP-specific phosphodiesterase class I)